MKIPLLFLLLCCWFSVFSQVASNENESTHFHDSIMLEKKYAFVIGFGGNIVDNTSTRNNQFLDWSQHYNIIPFPSKISLDRSWNSFFSTNIALTINQLYKEQYHNGELVGNISTGYVALDLLQKLFLDQYFFKKNWLDIDIGAGLGINIADKSFNQTFDAGAGIDIWIFPKWGLRFQTLGKFAFHKNMLANNHIQHSAEILWRF